MNEHIVQKIEECEFLLIGLGEELDLTEKESFKQYLEAICLSEEDSWMLPYIKRNLIAERMSEKLETYNQLAKSLEKKNYFIVSLAMDGIITKSNFDSERMVNPCGSYERLQCSKKCSTELYGVDNKICEEIEEYVKKISI